MTNKNLLFFALTLGTLMFASCDKDKEEPNTDHLKPKITFQQEKYTTEAGIAVKIVPTVANSKDATYKWETDGKAISTDSLLTFTPAEAKDYTLSLTVTNQYGEGKAQCVLKATPAAPYRNAVFMMENGSRGDNLGPGNPSQKVNGRLMAIKANGSFENDAFGKENGGKKLGYLCMQPVVFNNKIYILADAGSNDFDKSELVIADALTLKHEKTIAFDIGYDKATSLTIASEQKAYIGIGSQKLFPLNLVSGEKGGNIENLPRNFEGGILTPIIKIGDKVYGVNQGFRESGICAIDIATDKLVSTTKIPGKIAFFLNAKDGQTGLITEKTTDWGPVNFAFYSTKTSAVEGEEHKLPQDVSFAAVIATERNELYFHSRSNKGEIYRYNYKTKESELFAKAENVEYTRLHIATNKLYYTYKVSTGTNQFKTLVYNLDSSTPATPVGEAVSHTNIGVCYALVYK